jgi:malate permease and related proteins
MLGSGNLKTVLTSVLEVYGLVAAGWIYSRKLRPDLSWTLRLCMQVFIPCLVFVSFLDSRIGSGPLAAAAGATTIQILCSLLLGAVVLKALGWKDRRELLLPIAFVNSVNLPFPLLAANFGQDGLSLGVICNAVTNIFLFSVGIFILHGGGRMREALKEPTLWATVLGILFRLSHVQPPELAMKIPRAAGAAGVPLVLFLFGDALARVRITSARPAITAVALRYLSGAAAVLLTLSLFHPTGVTRTVLVLYALLPGAMMNSMLVARAGRDEAAVSSAILLGTLTSLVVMPLVLALVH